LFCFGKNSQGIQGNPRESKGIRRNPRESGNPKESLGIQRNSGFQDSVLSPLEKAMSTLLSTIAISTHRWRNKQIEVKVIAVSNGNPDHREAKVVRPVETDESHRG
jgi:hypothetical protein